MSIAGASGASGSSAPCGYEDHVALGQGFKWQADGFFDVVPVTEKKAGNDDKK